MMSVGKMAKRNLARKNAEELKAKKKLARDAKQTAQVRTKKTQKRK